MRRHVLFSLILLAMGSILSCCKLRLAGAIGPICIRTDGSIDPPDAPIQKAGDLYTLYSSITSDTDGIVIERGNMTFDGAGYLLQGAGSGTGISVAGAISNYSNVTIRNTRVESFYCGILLVDSSGDNTIIDNSISDNSHGIFLSGSCGNDISNNNVANNTYGIWLYRSSGNAISANKIMGNGGSIWLRDFSDNNTVIMNAMADSSGNGVWVFMSSGNAIVGNNITNNGNGIELHNVANNNSIIGNTVTHSKGFGIGLYSTSANTVSGNNLLSNSYGINLSGSLHCVIYHNNIINNTYQATCDSSLTNRWDDGYPSGGNFWSNYSGSDLNHDGIGDTIQVVGDSSTDNYPLMGMFVDFATSEHYLQVICNSTASDFQITGNTIRFVIAGEDGAQGFCRIVIPIALINGTCRIYVNGSQVGFDLLPFSNSTHSCFYFTYSHSAVEVVILPEFGSLPVLPLLVASTLLAALHKKFRSDN